MGAIRDGWMAVRGFAFVIAQVATLGILAMVLGLVALNAITHRPAAVATPNSEPSRPLQALIPTLVPQTPTAVAPTATPPLPTATIYVPPVVAQQTATALAPTDTPAPQPPPPTATPEPPPPTATPKPEPTKAAPAPTSAVAGQMMKVLPAADGLPARVRAQPTTKSPILVRVPLGATVQVLGTAKGDEIEPGNTRWVLIKWKDVQGYVYSTLVGEP